MKKYYGTSAKIAQRIVQKPRIPDYQWVDLSSPAQKTWASIWGTDVVRKGEETVPYYAFDCQFVEKLNCAVVELNNMCLEATDIAVKSNDFLRKFRIPEWSWDLIRSSWKGTWESGKKTFAGRFDIGINGKSLKMIEFNCDSAGTYLETGAIQGRWAKAVGCDVGKSASESLESLLVKQAKNLFKNFVHIMVDNDEEEIYNGLYIKELFGKAGVESSVIVGQDFKRSSEGVYVDSGGVEIRTVWKTWNWETVFADYEKPKSTGKNRISDVLLDPKVNVYEPIWKIVTSNKGILVLLWELFPNHPLLLRTEWSLSENFCGKSYVKKPIVGRCGQNIQIFTNNGKKIEENNGEYGDREYIYQELFEIQRFGDFNPILGVWLVGNTSGGFGIREDTKLIINNDSSFACCRVINC